MIIGLWEIALYSGETAKGTAMSQSAIRWYRGVTAHWLNGIATHPATL